MNALYINLVLVAPPPSAAFKSSSIISLLLLYFTFHKESNYIYMESQAYVNFYHMILFRCFISSKYLYVEMCDVLEDCHAQLMCWTCVISLPHLRCISRRMAYEDALFMVDLNSRI